MAGKPQKPAAQLQGHRPKRETRSLVDDGQQLQRIPSAPRAWHPVAKKAWRQFWSSSLPLVLDLQADDEALRRWGYCLSEQQKLEEILRDQPTVFGSQGQQVRNPLFDILRERTREIEKFRELFGMSPLHRMRLGITWDQADEARDRMQQRRRESIAPEMVTIGGAVGAGDTSEVQA